MSPLLLVLTLIGSPDQGSCHTESGEPNAQLKPDQARRCSVDERVRIHIERTRLVHHDEFREHYDLASRGRAIVPPIMAYIEDVDRSTEGQSLEADILVEEALSMLVTIHVHFERLDQDQALLRRIRAALRPVSHHLLDVCRESLEKLSSPPPSNPPEPVFLVVSTPTTAKPPHEQTSERSTGRRN